ncbi:peritrophin-48-like [Cryptotermes secundus]|uniref:peritrophin-48-like n=1 Tax=Cryptotermes secundus TaxID=105785 RepID=UPI000CD7CC99|nr:peritrophin-48-like [Cryptotermes secundus]
MQYNSEFASMSSEISETDTKTHRIKKKQVSRDSERKSCGATQKLYKAADSRNHEHRNKMEIPLPVTRVMAVHMIFSALLGCSVVKAFVCPSQGLFPDPADCSGYYSCNSKLQASRGTCPLSMHFDPHYTDCEVGDCSSSTQNQTLPPVAAATAPVDMHNGTFQCSDVGLFPDPTNCTAYLVCYGSAQAVRQVCPSGAYYNSSYRYCLPGTCLKGTTLTKKTLYCTSSSDTFPDPSDCHRYFRCDVNLKLVPQVCGLGFLFHYNVKTGGCSIGFC